MNKNIRLIQIVDQYDFNIILNMIKNDDELANTFLGEDNTVGRIVNSSFAAFIKDGNKTVGFIMLVYNEKTDIHEVDMGILTKYRNQGYGTIALGLVKDLIVREKVNAEVQIKNTNIAAIQTVIKNGFKLSKQDKMCNYYVVDEKRL